MKTSVTYSPGYRADAAKVMRQLAMEYPNLDAKQFIKFILRESARQIILSNGQPRGTKRVDPEVLGIQGSARQDLDAILNQLSRSRSEKEVHRHIEGHFG